MIWGSFFLCCPAVNNWYWVSVLCPVISSSILLFGNGVRFVEQAMNIRYKDNTEYQEYCNTVSIFIPLPKKKLISPPQGATEQAYLPNESPSFQSPAFHLIPIPSPPSSSTSHLTSLDQPSSPQSEQNKDSNESPSPFQFEAQKKTPFKPPVYLLDEAAGISSHNH
ncbi:uncharacterized protein MONOS_677 [Monocercomonoides exilis]|uniref:uncharacterized protein n=1 Tax=Monocercomonoides exilis TaxID=2049356 RepID=UPI00355A65E2|nr:hypothetical protein MONOS_677 [Monocercomonoides exilis]|eukprot:MONOS_677.1-p1 / transcript=MONOS_677.1 / gene=MONOS_677 / organism=Monocercomonoides_exilis_PA203 / gene_product=unspecified product / transcript_product=unspecified product / location=Mono_scaffold00011:132483-132980(-) / protein_length=165 / sequence_SO=supercontig / SO=protein_coding / is_pseudo=false